MDLPAGGAEWMHPLPDPDDEQRNHRKGGSDTGELIVAYPITSVHTVETSPEYMKMHSFHFPFEVHEDAIEVSSWSSHLQARERTGE